jgi:hypothetical protein
MKGKKRTWDELNAYMKFIRRVQAGGMIVSAHDRSQRVNEFRKKQKKGEAA